MRLIAQNQIEISRRNLEALAWALANTSDATLARYDEESGERIVVRVVEDADHYGERVPGPMPFDGLLAPSREQLAAFNEAMAADDIAQAWDASDW